MTNEENIKNELAQKYPEIADKILIKRERRIFAEIRPESFYGEAFNFIYDKLGFKILCTITGLDNGTTFGAKYHFANDKGIMLNVEVNVPKGNPVIKSVTATFPSADKYERELIDMFGFQVEGLAPGKRYPLPDDWPAGQHPLRKDWKKPETAVTEVKNG